MLTKPNEEGEKKNFHHYFCLFPSHNIYTYIYVMHAWYNLEILWTRCQVKWIINFFLNSKTSLLSLF